MAEGDSPISDPGTPGPPGISFSGDRQAQKQASEYHKAK